MQLEAKLSTNNGPICCLLNTPKGLVAGCNDGVLVWREDLNSAPEYVNSGKMYFVQGQADP